MVPLGLIVAVAGLALVGYGIYLDHTQEVIGANIGAGLLMLGGVGVAAIGAAVALFAAIHGHRRA